jgi:hypothetical protein
MLTDPASNVSVPLPVVIRRRSNVPERLTLPPVVYVLGSFPAPREPDAFQLFPLCLESVSDPNRDDDAEWEIESGKPLVI